MCLKIKVELLPPHFKLFKQRIQRSVVIGNQYLTHVAEKILLTHRHSLNAFFEPCLAWTLKLMEANMSCLPILFKVE